jgi:hypothetical protein
MDWVRKMAADARISTNLMSVLEAAERMLVEERTAEALAQICVVRDAIDEHLGSLR